MSGTLSRRPVPAVASAAAHERPVDTQRRHWRFSHVRKRARGVRVSPSPLCSGAWDKIRVCGGMRGLRDGWEVETAILFAQK